MKTLVTATLLISAMGASTIAHSATYVFQEGAEITVDGIGTGLFYTSTHDTQISTDSLNSPLGNRNSIWIDDWPTSTFNGLMRFDDIFGSGSGQVSVGSTITSASLGLNIFDGGTSLNFGEIHADQAWMEETATWASVLGGNGTTFGTDTTLLGVANPEHITGWNYTDVTSSLSAWALDASLNNGWAFAPDGGNTGLMAFYTSEAGQAFRPTLTVEVVSAVPVPAAVWLFGSGLIGLAGVARRKKA